MQILRICALFFATLSTAFYHSRLPFKYYSWNLLHSTTAEEEKNNNNLDNLLQRIHAADRPPWHEPLMHLQEYLESKRYDDDDDRLTTTLSFDEAVQQGVSSAQLQALVVQLPHVDEEVALWERLANEYDQRNSIIMETLSTETRSSSKGLSSMINPADLVTRIDDALVNQDFRLLNTLLEEYNHQSLDTPLNTSQDTSQPNLSLSIQIDEALARGDWDALNTLLSQIEVSPSVLRYSQVSIDEISTLPRVYPTVTVTPAVSESTTSLLDELPVTYQATVQAIDNALQNHADYLQMNQLLGQYLILTKRKSPLLLLPIEAVVAFDSDASSDNTTTTTTTGFEEVQALLAVVQELDAALLDPSTTTAQMDTLLHRLDALQQNPSEDDTSASLSELLGELEDEPPPQLYGPPPAFVVDQNDGNDDDDDDDLIGAYNQAMASQGRNDNVISRASSFSSSDGVSKDLPFFVTDPYDTDDSSDDSNQAVTQVDIAIVGAGLGGLCAGAILNTLYNKTVGIYEAHYLAGGCAHAFPRRDEQGVEYTFDSGPTIVLGSSSPPYNGLQQVLRAVHQEIEWIPYDGWGMIENPLQPEEKRWKVELGPTAFEQGPLLEFGGPDAVREFKELQDCTKGLVAGAAIPAMAMRSDSKAAVPLLRYFGTLFSLIRQGEKVTGTFGPYMDGPEYTVKNQWLRDWLDALAFSLSGLPASRTAAAAMAFILSDMHRSEAALDYPKGGMGEIVDALVRGVEQGNRGSRVNLRSRVASIQGDGTKVTGLTLANGHKVVAKEGVIYNAPVWTLESLLGDDELKNQLGGSTGERMKPVYSWSVNEKIPEIEERRQHTDAKDTILDKCANSEMTGSFLHLHLAINSTGLDTASMLPHYTVMDRGLSGDSPKDGPCGVSNMIAVSNPCILDPSLSPPGTMVLHAYSAGNEPYQLWHGLKGQEYLDLKKERCHVLWRAVESVIPDVRERILLSLEGSPLTHARFLRRPAGTYGSATEDYLPNGATPISNLVLANDGVFPGIGVPAVAIAGASAANAFVGVGEQWKCLDSLKREGRI